MPLAAGASEYRDNSVDRRRRVGAEQLRQQLLNSLAGYRGPVTTAALRDRLHADRDPASLTIEAVYRNLTLLHRRGQVRQIRTGGRHVSWTLASGSRRSRGAGDAA